VDFPLVLIERFARCYGWGAASKNSGAARFSCEGVQRWSWGTHSGLQGRVQQPQPLDDCTVNNAVLIETAVSCWHLHQLLL